MCKNMTQNTRCVVKGTAAARAQSPSKRGQLFEGCCCFLHLLQKTNISWTKSDWFLEGKKTGMFMNPKPAHDFQTSGKKAKSAADGERHNRSLAELGPDPGPSSSLDPFSDASLGLSLS